MEGFQSKQVLSLLVIIGVPALLILLVSILALIAWCIPFVAIVAIFYMPYSLIKKRSMPKKSITSTIIKKIGKVPTMAELKNRNEEKS